MLDSNKIIKTESCWLWCGSRMKKGYGQAQHNGRVRLVHRIAFECEYGPIPQGMQIDHLCRNKACVRPSHLEPVTPRENTMRGIGPAAKNARKTHCKNGHPFSGRNLMVYRDRPGADRRDCRQCMLDRASRYRQKRRVRVIVTEAPYAGK